MHVNFAFGHAVVFPGGKALVGGVFELVEVVVACLVFEVVVVGGVFEFETTIGRWQYEYGRNGSIPKRASLKNKSAFITNLGVPSKEVKITHFLPDF